MTAAERARAWIADGGGGVRAGGNDIESLARLILEAEARALEDAARFVDGYPLSVGIAMYTSGHVDEEVARDEQTAKAIAAALRAESRRRAGR